MSITETIINKLSSKFIRQSVLLPLDIININHCKEQYTREGRSTSYKVAALINTSTVNTQKSEYTIMPVLVPEVADSEVKAWASYFENIRKEFKSCVPDKVSDTSNIVVFNTAADFIKMIDNSLAFDDSKENIGNRVRYELEEGYRHNFIVIDRINLVKHLFDDIIIPEGSKSIEELETECKVLKDKINAYTAAKKDMDKSKIITFDNVCTTSSRELCRKELCKAIHSTIVKMKQRLTYNVEYFTRSISQFHLEEEMLARTSYFKSFITTDKSIIKNLKFVYKALKSSNTLSSYETLARIRRSSIRSLDSIWQCVWLSLRTTSFFTAASTKDKDTTLIKLLISLFGHDFNIVSKLKDKGVKYLD